MIFFKAAVIAIITAATVLIIRQIKPEYAVCVQLSGIATVALLAISLLNDILAEVNSLTAVGAVNEDMLKLLFKALGIAVTADIASDICKDSGSSAVAGTVELLSKIVILAMAVPMIKTVAEFAVGLINR